MLIILFVVHVLIALALVGVVMLQKSEGGALGMGGGGMSGFMTGRSTANLLTRATAILAGLFFATSIALALLASSQRAPHSVVDTGSPPASSAPAPLLPAAPSQAPAPAGPAAPRSPSAPLAK